MPHLFVAQRVRLLLHHAYAQAVGTPSYRNMQEAENVVSPREWAAQAFAAIAGCCCCCPTLLLRQRRLFLLVICDVLAIGRWNHVEGRPMGVLWLRWPYSRANDPR